MVCLTATLHCVCQTKAQALLAEQVSIRAKMACALNCSRNHHICSTSTQDRSSVLSLGGLLCCGRR